MMMKRSLLVAGLALMLTACGFHLRGTGQSELALKEINVSARDAYGDTVRMVRRSMENSGVKVYAGAPYTLFIARESEERRSASLTSTGRGLEYQLSLRADYEIHGLDGLLLTSGTAEVEDYFSQDINNLTGSEQEANRLREEMRRDLVQQLVQRVGRVTPDQLERMQQEAEVRAQAEREALEAARQYRSAPQQSPAEPYEAP